MKMTMEQTKLVYLTMELELKAKEYEQLCKKLDRLQVEGVDSDDGRLEDLKKEFEENLKEIKNIKKELQILNGNNED